MNQAVKLPLKLSTIIPYLSRSQSNAMVGLGSVSFLIILGFGLSLATISNVPLSVTSRVYSCSLCRTVLRKNYTVSRSYKIAVCSHSIPMLLGEPGTGRSDLLRGRKNAHWVGGCELTVQTWLSPMSLSAYASWARGKWRSLKTDYIVWISERTRCFEK